MVTSVSREALAMDEKTVGTNDIQFENSKGVFLKRKTLIFSLLFGVLVLAAAVVITFFIAKCEESPKPPEPVVPPPIITDVRLPSHILPSHYDIKLLPNITGDLKLIGHVVITMDCVLDSWNITLHKDDIDIDQTSVKLTKQSDNKEVKISSHQYDAKRQFYIIKTGQQLLAGSVYTLEVRFKGSLTDKLAGFYLSKYWETNQEHKMGVTQFQATDARKAFPCFDEPKFKAKFSIKLARPRSGNWITLSNMEREAETEDEEWVWDVYKESVKMSTYLVAFVVAEFEFVEGKFSGDRSMKFYARPSAKGQLELAQTLAPKVIDFYEDYFNISFPLEKCDMIAVPDFNAGAMENWGLVTYREATMLFDSKVSTASNNQRVAVVIAHELAHQWFGNLVTPFWWTDLWLNEGFASFVEYLGVNSVRPNWKMNEQFVIDELQDVLELDALVTSHPISQPVLNPDEITELFDRISYGKGASIIRMMYNFLGERGFKEGVTAYLNELQYSNADQDDLWRHLYANSENTLPTPVKDIMDTWTLQTGYPVVEVTRNYETNTFQAVQKRFVLDPSVLSNSTQNYKWWIYLTWSSASQIKGNKWMSPEITGHEIKENGATPSDWMVFNVDQFGFFRVNYDEENWNLLREQLVKDFTAVSVINRGQILDDSFELAKAGQLDYAIALNMTVYLEKETAYVPIEAAFGKLAYIDLMVSRKEAYGQFQPYMQSIIRPMYDSVDEAILKETEYEKTDITQVYRAVTLQRLACRYEASDKCVGDAVSKFKAWMESYESSKPDAEGIPVNMKRTIYCTAIRKGTIKEWDFLYKHQQNSNLASEKRIALDSLACTEEVWILSRYLEWILDPSKIRKQDAPAVFQLIAMNNVGRYLAFDFMRNNWDTLSAYFGQGIGGMDRFVSSVSNGFNTEFEIQQLKAFEKEHENTLGSATRATKQAIEAAENNFKWMERNYDTIHNWLINYNSHKGNS